jgi:hypothetical protein
MEKINITAISKPLMVGSWFIVLGILPFVFASRGIPLWVSIFFFFFAFICIIQIKRFELSLHHIHVKNVITGKTTIIERNEIAYVAIGDMPETMASRMGLMKRARMATVKSTGKINISIGSFSTGHPKFHQVEQFLEDHYYEYFKHKLL